MLDDIDAVPWANLRHAFGAATDLPARIRALAAKDRDERQAALKELFARLVHQGSVFDATPRAVPFLFELLADESTPDKNWLAFLLSSIADGKGYIALHLDLGETLWRKILAERGTTLERELEHEARVIQDVQREVGQQAELLVPYLNDGQSEIRAAVARSLGGQAAHAAELLPALEAREARETATDARDALRLALARLRQARFKET
jgi:hypothetical protein